MSFIKKIIRKNKDGTTKEYYAEVESVRIGNKVRHRYIRSLGSDPKKPNKFPLEKMEFSNIALLLMQGELVPNDVFLFTYFTRRNQKHLNNKMREV